MPVLQRDCPRCDNGHSHQPTVCPCPLAAPLVPSFGNRAACWDAGAASRPQPAVDPVLSAHCVFILCNRLRQATHFPIPLVPTARVGRQALESTTTDGGKGPGAQGDTDYLLAAWPWVSHSDPQGLNHVASVADTPVSSPQSVLLLVSPFFFPLCCRLYNAEPPSSEAAPWSPPDPTCVPRSWRGFSVTMMSDSSHGFYFRV